MELKAQYDLNDLLDLVEQDLEAKGFRLMGGFSPVINGGEGLLLTLAIEQLGTKTISPALPALPAPAPAATVTRAANSRPRKPKETNLTEGEIENQEAKRAYWREQARKKRLKQNAGEEATKPSQSMPEVVAPTTSPFPVSELLLSNGLSTSSY